MKPKPPRILATMPGQFGDIITAALTVRAISEHFGGVKVDYKISHHYAGLALLLRREPYIGEVLLDVWNLAQTGPVYTLERWEAGQMTAEPWKPVVVPEGYDHVAHLQFRSWPYPTCIAANAEAAEIDLGLEPGTLRPDVSRPWITADYRERFPYSPIVGNWRKDDEGKPWFIAELHARGGIYIASPTEHVGITGAVTYCDWLTTARAFQGARTIVCCQSAPWVLANAMHHPDILTIEPDRRRWASEFWLPTPGNRRGEWKDLDVGPRGALRFEAQPGGQG